MKKLTCLLIALISFAALSFSQQPWTLSDCIDYALANNIQIKRSQLQAEVAEINLLQSKTNIFPGLNGNASRDYRFGRQVDPFTNEFIGANSVSDNFSLSSSVGIFQGLQNYNNIRSNHYATLAALQNVEREKVEKTLEISSAYLAILFQQELLDVALNQRSVTDLQVVRTGKLVEAGSVARGDLLEIQAQLAGEDLNVTNARNNLQLSILNLVQLLDLDSAGGFSVVFPDSIDINLLPDLPDVYQVYDEALGYLPHIKMYDYRMKSAERNLMVQKGRISPTLYMTGSLYTGYSDQRTLFDENNNPIEYPYSDQINDNFAQSLSIGISVPLFNQWEVVNNISKAKIQLSDSELELYQIKQGLYQNIQQAHNDAVSARAKYNSALKAVNSYTESFHYTEQKYNVGIVNSVEYNIAKNNYIRAESELLQAKYEYIFSVKILDFYRGIPMSL